MDRKLIAAIMGAVSAYIEREQQPLSTTPRLKAPPKVNRVEDFPTAGVNES